MANNTILIAAPEHGRNQEPNTVIDAFGRYAIDHTSDAMSREIFCLVVGPAGKVVQGQTIAQQVGQSIDIVPTIAHILGFHGDVAAMLPGQVLNQALA
jgi:phosphoglycerol transferase MdoB-like AlkP superfamily enzyme